VRSRSSKPGGEILNLHMSDPLASIRPWELWRRGAPKKVVLAAVQESVAGPRAEIAAPGGTRRS
jgi:hypothetical protein